ncbi:hypothetical protein [Neobacillus sp. DY30]|uniref:hypothetical protein n=1 Tax=Neobacillus sp. DY30 TaxID=3047871 RepID=UPI0024BFC19C|nr:hypothetical protein [Neobacillus sp. DY30]WHY01458.1 hypothetical protein QNH29_04185 [Neobacillus sp. DY30]
MMDTIQFKQLSHTFVRELDGEFVVFREGYSQRNYYSVEYTLRGESYFVLLNHHYPFLAFSSTMEDITFIDVPVMTAKYQSYYKVLTKEFLETPLASEHLSALSQAEIEQISYWKPSTVGEVIFNNWD